MIKKLLIGVGINTLLFFAVAYGLSFLIQGHGDLLGSAVFAGIFGCLEYIFMLSYFRKQQKNEENEDEEEDEEE